MKAVTRCLAVAIVVMAVSAVACSAENGENGGQGGSSIRPGVQPQAGNGATAGGGAAGQTAGVPGMAGLGPVAGEDSNGGSAGEEICADVSVAVDRMPINVMLVVDRSTTMVIFRFGNQTRWDALYNALMAQPDGLVFSMQGIIRFGFSSYTNYPGTSPMCPDLVTVFPPAFNNYDPINAAYSGTPARMDLIGETPTGEALSVILDQLLPWAAAPGPDGEFPGPTFILLATDGEPDSCADIAQDTEGRNDPARQMVVDQVLRALGAGVQTYVLSVGTDVGDQHLQAVANAGVGAAPGQNAPFWKADNPQGLQDALATIIGGVVSCQLELQGEITDAEGACELGTVVLNGVELVCGDESNGWRVVDATHIELLGAACDQFKLSSAAILEAKFPCEVVLIQ